MSFSISIFIKIDDHNIFTFLFSLSLWFLFQNEIVIEVDVKPGYHAGTKMTFHNRGDQRAPGGEAGDVQVCFF